MSNSKINLVSSAFVKLAVSVLKENCTVDPETGEPICVARPVLVKKLLKKHRKALPTKNVRLLTTMLELAEQAGQLTGFESRRGRNGGLFRNEETPVRKPRKAKVEQAPAEASEAPTQQAA